MGVRLRRWPRGWVHRCLWRPRSRARQRPWRAQPAPGKKCAVFPAPDGITSVFGLSGHARVAVARACPRRSCSRDVGAQMPAPCVAEPLLEVKISNFSAVSSAPA
eukprot:7255808-Pyramimonas_sp.AAC.1